MADRIQARAIRRCGERLKQIEPANGSNQNIRAGDNPKVTRNAAAAEAGRSEHQRKTALRVALIPEQEFHDAVEAEIPPTVTGGADCPQCAAGAMQALPFPAPQVRPRS